MRPRDDLDEGGARANVSIRSLRLAIAWIAFPACAAAQTLTGTITRFGEGVEGAIVLLMAPDGRETARVASGEGGRYEVRAPAGTYRVRVLQIGWVPTAFGPVILRQGMNTAAHVNLVAPRLTLAAITVSDRAQCTVRPDSSAAAFAIWDAARTSLLATMLTRLEPVTATLTRSDRTFDRDGTRVLSDSSTTRTVHSLTPLRSLNARALNDSGYVIPDASGGRTFWAPDADVLLSEEFVSGHCMSAVTSTHPDSTSLIGVRFAPAARRRDIVDIEGILWLDRRTAELRTLQYRYATASAAARETNAGGEVEFLRIPRGKVLVHRWSMRYPVVALRVSAAPPSEVPGMRNERPTREQLLGVRTSSGSILEIRRGQNVLWERGRVSIVARVVDSATAAPLSRVLVGLAGSPDATATDSSGGVRLDRLAPGVHTIRIRSPELTDLGLPQILRQITVPETNDEVLTLAIPSARSIVASRCGQRSLDRGEGMLVGRVRADSGRLATASILALSRTPYVRLGGGEPVLEDQLHEVTPRADGTFHLCGIPRGATVRVRKSSDKPGTGVALKFADRAFTATVEVP